MSALGAPKVLGLDHVVLRVRDLDAALRFYTGMLGCTRPSASLIDLVPVDSPLGKAGGGAPDPAARNVDHFCLRIEPFDADALAAHLRAHGVAPGDVGERYGADGTGPSMYVRDPDGNVVELKGPPVRRGP